MGCTIVYPAPFLEDHDKLLHENLCQGSWKICEATCVTSAGKVAKNWLVLSYFFIIYSALSAILLCLLFCSDNYSALSAILLCQLFCSVSYSAMSAILLCQLFCSVSYSALSAILLYHLFFSIIYSALSAILLYHLFCSVSYSSLSAILLFSLHGFFYSTLSANLLISTI